MVCDKMVLSCNVLHVDLFGTISMNINNNLLWNLATDSLPITTQALYIDADYDNNKEMHDSHRPTNYS